MFIVLTVAIGLYFQFGILMQNLLASFGVVVIHLIKNIAMTKSAQYWFWSGVGNCFGLPAALFNERIEDSRVGRGPH